MPASLLACANHAFNWSNWWDWDHCYCAWRTAVLPLVALVLLGFWSYGYLFLNRYLAPKRPPFWPLEAFWRAVAWHFFLMCVTAAVLFAGVSDEWRKDNWQKFPLWLNWLNWHWPWISVLVVGAFLSVMLVLLTRRRGRG